MNIENLKNIPAVGQDPIMVQVVHAIASFQADLKTDEVAQIETAGTGIVAELETARLGYETSWGLDKNVRVFAESPRRDGKIDELEKHGQDEVARLLGVSGTANTDTIFGLIKTLELEDADWNSVLTANFNNINDQQNAYFEAVGVNEDIDALSFDI